MDRVRSVVSSRESMTYTGPFDSLNSQASFDLIAGPNPTMPRLVPGKNKQSASEDTEYLATKLLEFCNFYQLHIFCDSVQLQYIGTDSYDSQTMLADISLTLTSLKTVSNYKGKVIVLMPDDLYSRYIEFLSLLAPDAITWSFPLVTLFFHALPSNLREAMQSGRYVLPNLSTLLTSHPQEQEL